MTVIHAAETHLGAGTKPDWCQMTSGGFFSLPGEGGEHDCHYHEYNELYLICRGRAKILNAGVEVYVQARDIVCIRAGDEHDILEVYGGEELRALLALRARPGRRTPRAPAPKRREGTPASCAGKTRSGRFSALTVPRVASSRARSGVAYVDPAWTPLGTSGVEFVL